MFSHSFALEVAYAAVEETVRLGASYADARYECNDDETIEMTNGRLPGVLARSDRGLGIRVLVRGAWGFVSVSEPSRHDVLVAARRAVDIARAAAVFQQRPVKLASQQPIRSSFRTQLRRDPLAVPIEDKVEFLTKVDDRLRTTGRTRERPDVSARSTFFARRTHKVYVNSEGAEIDQELVWTGAGCFLGLSQLRSSESEGLVQSGRASGGDGDVGGGERLCFGRSPGPHVRVGAAGWEFLSQLKLLERAERISSEFSERSPQTSCPFGQMPVIFDAEAASSLVFHTWGRRAELDLMDRPGRESVASRLVHVYADASLPGAAGHFGFDDEGVEGQRIDLVSEGLQTAFLSGREAAGAFGFERSSGACRAASWVHAPQVRCTNLALAGGDAGSLESLIADTKTGILLEGPQTFSVDEEADRFEARSRLGWLIKDGQRAEPVTGVSYQGRLFDLWAGCDAVGDGGVSEWFGWMGQDVKGEPSQAVFSACGSPPIRFASVDVGPRLEPSSLSKIPSSVFFSDTRVVEAVEASTSSHLATVVPGALGREGSDLRAASDLSAARDEEATASDDPPAKSRRKATKKKTSKKKPPRSRTSRKDRR